VKRHYLVVLLLAPWITACAVGSRYSPPKIAMPAAWQEAPSSAIGFDRSTLEHWWTTFHDPVLDDLVARAVNGNLDLKIAAARVREARAAGGIVASAALPQVDVNGQYVRSERSDAVPPFKSAGASSPFGPRTQNIFQAGFDAGWELDVFGGVRRDVEAAVAQVEAAEDGQRDVLVILLGDVARNYAELRGAQRQLEILDGTLRSLRDTGDLAKSRFDAGLGTALDVERAEGLLNETTSRQPEIELTARHAIYRLAVLLGEQPAAFAPALGVAQAMRAAPPEVPAALPSELLSRRPDLRRAEREVAAATARTGVATADLFPRFSISGNFGRRSENVSDLGSGVSQSWFLVPGVRWPVLSGGRIRANIRVHEARAEQALGQYEKAVLAAVEEVENSLAAQSRQGRRVESLRASVESNRRALDLATERYTGGLENFLSVLDAQRSLYSVEDGLAGSETRSIVSVIALYKALGGGWSLDPTTIPNSDRPTTSTGRGGEAR
jgi:NodT family efflux transporter outer membrane factor (OMF) lipoprotein